MSIVPKDAMVVKIAISSVAVTAVSSILPCRQRALEAFLKGNGAKLVN